MFLYFDYSWYVFFQIFDYWYREHQLRKTNFLSSYLSISRLFFIAVKWSFERLKKTWYKYCCVDKNTADSLKKGCFYTANCIPRMFQVHMWCISFAQHYYTSKCVEQRGLSHCPQLYNFLLYYQKKTSLFSIVLSTTSLWTFDLSTISLRFIKISNLICTIVLSTISVSSIVLSTDCKIHSFNMYYDCSIYIIRTLHRIFCVLNDFYRIIQNFRKVYRTIHNVSNKRRIVPL